MSPLVDKITTKFVSITSEAYEHVVLAKKAKPFSNRKPTTLVAELPKKREKDADFFVKFPIAAEGSKINIIINSKDKSVAIGIAGKARERIVYTLDTARQKVTEHFATAKLRATKFYQETVPDLLNIAYYKFKHFNCRVTDNASNKILLEAQDIAHVKRAHQLYFDKNFAKDIIDQHFKKNPQRPLEFCIDSNDISFLAVQQGKSFIRHNDSDVKIHLLLKDTSPKPHFLVKFPFRHVGHTMNITAGYSDKSKSIEIIDRTGIKAKFIVSEDNKKIKETFDRSSSYLNNTKFYKKTIPNMLNIAINLFKKVGLDAEFLEKCKIKAENK